MFDRELNRKDFLKAGLMLGSAGLVGTGASAMAGEKAGFSPQMEQLLNSSKEVMGIRNVKGFGAKGDGKTDDTAAILKAMENLPKSGSNPVGMIFFPPGNYLVSRQKAKDFCIQIGPEHEIILAGCGSGSVLETKDDKATILDMDGTLGDNIRRITIRDLHITGGRTGIRLNYAYYDRIMDCFFHSQKQWGIEITSSMRQPTSLSIIQGNIFTHTCGILIDGSKTGIGTGNGLQIIGNIIGEDIRSRAAICLVKTGGVYGQASITNNTIYEPNTDAIAMEEADMVLVANNRILKPAGIGVRLDKCDSIQVHGNLFYGTRSDGIRVAKTCTNIQVVGNLFRSGPFEPRRSINTLGTNTAIYMNDFPKGSLADKGQGTRKQLNSSG